MHRHHLSPLAAAIAVSLCFATAAHAAEQKDETVQLEATQIEI